MTDVAAIIGEYLTRKAQWRDERAEEYPGDDRNARSADRLRQLADFILALPPSDTRLESLSLLCADDVALASPELDRSVSRIGFDQEDADLDRITTWLAKEASVEPARWEAEAR